MIPIPCRRNTLLPVTWLCLLLAGCAGNPEQAEHEVTEEETAAEVQAYIQSERVIDDRGRFREIFCAVLESHGELIPDYRPCEEALRDIGEERGSSGAAVALGQGNLDDTLVLLVPGLGWNCFAEWLDLSNSGPKHVANYGYDVRFVPVDGLSSTSNNARMINEYVQGLPEEDASRPLVLMGYSKGAPDILTALVEYPELAARVDGVVSVAGAVGGSELAADAKQGQANMLTMVPGSQCEEEDGDNDAVASLKPDIRKRWLKENPLPDHIRYYSVITFPEPERVSRALTKSYLLLGQTDSRNDTQLVIFDQFVPASKAIAVANADHWAIAVPVARTHPLLSSALVDQNDYPREAFLEALLRYMEEDRAR